MVEQKKELLPIDPEKVRYGYAEVTAHGRGNYDGCFFMHLRNVCCLSKANEELSETNPDRTTLVPGVGINELSYRRREVIFDHNSVGIWLQTGPKV